MAGGGRGKEGKGLWESTLQGGVLAFLYFFNFFIHLGCGDVKARPLGVAHGGAMRSNILTIYFFTFFLLYFTLYFF